MQFTLLLLPLFWISCAPLKILVYSPLYAASHTNFMARLADTLTEAGHNVTFFTPIIDESRKDQLGVKVTKDVVKLERDITMQTRKVTIDDIMSIFWTMDVTSKNGHRVFETIHEQAVLTCGNLFRSKELIEELRSRQYDVALAEPLMTCAMNSQVTEKMDFTARLENYEMYMVVGKFGEMFDDEAKVYRSHLGQDFPDWRTLIPDASLHFVNAIPSIDFPRPSLQKTIEIGGISVDVDNIERLEETSTFSNILDKRSKNMFISFGTLTKSTSMPEDFKRNLLEVFKSQPNCTFIWKYESEDVEFADGVENVEFVKWAPQAILLNDPRMSAFLTHGGLGSTNEAAFLGIPTIMIPIFADQSRNANMLGRHGMSIVLHKRDLGNFEKLREAVHEILHNSKYRENAERISKMVRNQPLKPKDLVVKYIEFVGRFGPFPQMSPYSLKMSAFQRYNYDIYAYKIASFVIPIVVFMWIFYKILANFPLKIVKIEKVE